MAIDAELCSSDGVRRTDRMLTYGSPLSAQKSASHAPVLFVIFFDLKYLPKVGPAAFPIWVETPWNQ